MFIDIAEFVKASGPVFDGTAVLEVQRFARHIEDVLGDIAVTRIRAYLPTQYMYLGHHGGTPEFNPVPPNAGMLQAAVHSERQVADAVVVTSDPVTYGPWIEGTDLKNQIVWPHHRNPPPRRFPGYHTFRIIGQELNAEASAIAEAHLPPYIMAMNA